MKKVLVTGGCGFLGSHVVHTLIDRGVDHVRIFALPNETTANVAELEVEIVRGNVLSPEDCARAVDGMDTVFHLAAIYKGFMPDPTMMYEVNNRGTFNMLEASRRAEIEKVIYTASIVALGRPPAGQLGDEDTEYDAWDLTFAYSRSKYHSRKIAEDFGKWGMDVRVVCPGIVFGPGDVGPTPSGKLIIEVLSMRPFKQAPRVVMRYMRNENLEGMPPLYVDGGASFVDVRDAAQVHVLAAEKGSGNRRYIATAHNMSQHEFLMAINRAVGFERRFVKLPAPVARRIIDAMEQYAIKTNSEPAMSRSFFEYSLKPSYFSNRRSVQELGATYRPIEDTIRDAVEYFQEVGYLP